MAAKQVLSLTLLLILSTILPFVGYIQPTIPEDRPLAAGSAAELGREISPASARTPAEELNETPVSEPVLDVNETEKAATPCADLQADRSRIAVETAPERSRPQVAKTVPADAAPASARTASPPPPPPAAPAYRWGAQQRVTFRTGVKLTNSGHETAEQVRVDLPLLDNRSPYQDNTLLKTSHAVESNRGRVASFYLGDLAPGETVTLHADYRITIRPVALVSADDAVKKAEQAFREFAGRGNCRTLANGFVGRCGELGVTARVVNGFTRPQRALLSPGPLQGCRHSWAEFQVDGLGWVPVDLTFGYFADFPYASHLIESYDDEPVRVNYLGGKVDAVWENAVLP